jgi:hypothetical protein
MIWSDMYFRMGSKTGDYYDMESEIPADVAAAIPAEVQLVYWDYYHTDEEFYREWIRRHRDLGFEPIMASGVWTWGRFVHSHTRTSQTVLPCVRACLTEGLKEIIFTMWKDDGGGVDFNSAWAGVLMAVEAAYGAGEVVQERWAARFRGICRAELDANLAISRIDASERFGEEINVRLLLWDDPLLSLYRRSLTAREAWRDFDPAAFYTKLAEELAPLAEKGSGEAGDLKFACQLAATLSLKSAVYDRLTRAYADDDRETLAILTDSMIPTLIVEVKTLWEQHRHVWMSQNKAFGFEVQCVRYGGLLLRLEEVSLRIKEYLSGEAAKIDELETPVQPLAESFGSYRSVATASSIL